jgi:hypothetical protein
MSASVVRRVVSIGQTLTIAAILAASTSACGESRPTGPTGPTPPTGSTGLPLAPQIDGTYVLRFDSTCGALPVELRSRTYTASIAGSPNVVVTLTGADFWTAPADGPLNRFTGQVLGNSVSFSLYWPPGTQRWGFVERVGTDRYLEILGLGAGSITGSTIEGRWSAGIGYGTDLRDDEQHVGCQAAAHVLTFRFSRTAGSRPSTHALH